MIELIALGLLLWALRKATVKPRPPKDKAKGFVPPPYMHRSTTHAARLGRDKARGTGRFWKKGADYSGDDWGW